MNQHGNNNNSRERNIKALVETIKETKTKRVLVQLPDGLKGISTEILDALHDNGVDALLSSDACYGACDLRDLEAKQAECDMLVNVGHNKFYKQLNTAVPVIYYEWPLSLDLENIEKILRRDIGELKGRKIGLVTTIQHLDELSGVSRIIEKLGRKAVEGGQILGCWNANAAKIESKVDCFLVIASGYFHAGAIRTKKPVYLLNLELGEVEDFTEYSTKMLKRRFAKIAKAKDAKSFGLLVSTKPGQFGMEQALKAKKMLESKNRKAYIIVADLITKESLEGIKVEAFINTACPRIIEDDLGKPVVDVADINLLFE